jgi:streptogramin lyase
MSPDGNLYFCEIGNHVIRRLDLKTHALTVVAGTGDKGYSGDGGPATKAQLNEPYDVRFDTDDNMYFVEMKNNIVRRVDPKTKVISTIAKGSIGTGERGDGPDGDPLKCKLARPHGILAAPDGKIYVADTENHRIRMLVYSINGRTR